MNEFQIDVKTPDGEMDCFVCHPDDIKAAASLYGTRMVTDQPESPHLLAELYLGYAEHDPYVEDFVIPILSAALDEHGVNHVSEIHPGTEHGFCFRERPAYNEAAAEKVRTTVFDLYSRTLNQGQCHE